MSEAPVFKPVRLLIPLGIFAFGLAVYFLMGGSNPAPREVVAEKKLHEVTVQAAQAYDQPLVLEVDGAVVPYRKIQLATQVAGLIDEKSEHCRAGNFVKKKELLFRIDQEDFKFECSRWEKQKQQATIELEELKLEIDSNGQLLQLAKMDRDLSRKELDRLKRLKDGQIITESDVDKSERALLTSENAVVQLNSRMLTFNKRTERLKAAQELAGIELDQANRNLERTEVKTPIDGVITRELVEEDSFVQKGATLVVIEDTSQAEVKCNLRMEEMYWIWSHEQQQSAEAVPASPVLAAGSQGSDSRQHQLPRIEVDVIYKMAGKVDIEYTWPGHLERYDGHGIDPDTRMVPVRVVVKKPRRKGAGPPRLVPGMYVTVRIKVKPRVELIHIPEGAIQPGNKLWVIEPEEGSGQRARLKQIDQVSIVQRIEGASGAAEERWLIDATAIDLQPGSLVVTRPLVGVSKDDLVRYRQTKVPRLKSTGSAENSSTGASQQE